MGELAAKVGDGAAEGEGTRGGVGRMRKRPETQGTAGVTGAATTITNRTLGDGARCGGQAVGRNRVSHIGTYSLPGGATIPTNDIVTF
jgi:hypothetical protein